MVDVNENFSATRGLLWESVLRRSIKSGDVDRVAAAIGLAEEGGASLDVLEFSRRELKRLAEAALLGAIRGGFCADDEKAEQPDVATGDRITFISEAIERAEELGIGNDALFADAVIELRRLAGAGLDHALSVATVEALRVAVRTAEVAYDHSRDENGTVCTNSDDEAFVKLSRARRQLKLLLKAEASGSCLVRSNSKSTCTTGTGSIAATLSGCSTCSPCCSSSSTSPSRHGERQCVVAVSDTSPQICPQCGSDGVPVAASGPVQQRAIGSSHDSYGCALSPYAGREASSPISVVPAVVGRANSSDGDVEVGLERPIAKKKGTLGSLYRMRSPGRGVGGGHKASPPAGDRGMQKDQECVVQ